MDTIDQDTKNKIIKMYQDGFAIKKLSVKFNINDNLIKKLIKELNIQILKKQYSIDKKDEIMQLYSAGVSAKNLAYAYSMSKSKIIKWSKEKNIFRDPSKAIRSFIFNENIFDIIDIPEKAYWLGFLYADAYNNEKENVVRLALAKKDLDHVYKFAKFAEINSNKVFIYDKVKHPKAIVNLNSKHLCQALKNAGCPQTKTFIIKYPEFLNENLDSHFIRGMFDGDGCLYYNYNNKEHKFSLVSTKECLERIVDIFSINLDITPFVDYFSKTNNNTYIICIKGNEQIYRVMTWLYTDAQNHMMLTRKYNKYLFLKQHQENRNINRPNYLLSKETKDNILKDYFNGINIEQITEKYKIHKITIFRLIKKHKIKK